MGYAYLPFTIILACFTVFECRRHDRSFRWIPAVLAFPPAAVYLLIKTRGRSGIILMAVILVLFIAVSGFEGYRYTVWKEQHKYDHLPPVLKKMTLLNEEVKADTIEIYALSGKLDSTSMVQSRTSDINTALGLIEQLKDKTVENQGKINLMLGFTNEHHDFLAKKNLGWVFAVEKFYNHPAVAHHNACRSAYYAALETLLKYTRENFNNIMALKSQVHMKNYDVYYLRYRRTADTLNRVNRERIRFQNEFVQDYPEVAPFLPGSHHLEPFRFWDKFSF